ncbi:DUF3772 domain-containing protein [Litoreibacter roseus]|uniref:Mechanosensitive ion channel protein MscS n=1 Tax=Litoreibacter roseus TaxID=2601869 RepID=A0A6N6JKT8_9RHOB|nr:DUF3772 domain-containing protein [Litoreibacter roseus]GFE66655.1 mechanosensitive ion channel protein MscS [Litoreibacter roseus]
MRYIKVLLLCVFSAFCVAAVTVPSGLVAQTSQTQSGQPDYNLWDRVASRADNLLADENTTLEQLDSLSSELFDWRQKFLAAQSINSERITTLRNQIETLGPKPAEGEAEEAPEIAERRSELNSQLNTLLTPVRRAEEAFTQVNGLIGEVDALLIERQTNRVLELGPSPLMPATWNDTAKDVSRFVTQVRREVVNNFNSPIKRKQLHDNLPVIVVLLVVAGLLILRSNAWIDKGLNYLRKRESSSRAGYRVGVFFISLVSMALPILGLSGLIEAADQSMLTSRVGDMLLRILSATVIILFVSRWLGQQVFPAAFPPRPILNLSARLLGRGRRLAVAAGILLALRIGIRRLGEEGFLSDAAIAVLGFPILLLGGYVLFRLARLMTSANEKLAEVEDDAEAEVKAEAPVGLILRFLSRGTILLAVIGPLLGLIGYRYAGNMLVFSALQTVALVGLVAVLQRLARDTYALFVGDDRLEDGLIPVILSFALTILATPFFLLIWGARTTQLQEAWTVVATGFQIGSTRISPTDFLTFAIIFAIGYMLTRFLQGALKTQVLPKTRIDTGGRNAIISGTGYVGIFLAAVIAITTAGIDLSSLAIVAGALSVGIGFGLQTIVSNFVSGIILLIERPVSEGDWIEVGGTMGVVKDISVRATRIETFDRRDVIVPNADLISTSVTNWTKGNLSGRLIVPVGVAYGSDTRKVQEILQGVAEDHPVVILRPPPSVFFIGFGADSLDFEIRAILRDVNHTLSAQTEMRHNIVKRFEEEGIEIPFAQRDVWLRNPEVLQQAAPQQEPPEDPTPKGPREDLELSDPSDDSSDAPEGDDAPQP